MSEAQYRIIDDNHHCLLIKDTGSPWNKFPTITNDAENVVAKLASSLNGRRLYYIDSEGRIDELIVEDGKFAGFSPGTRMRRIGGYVISHDGKSILCETCGRRSFHPEDVANKYCGHCHVFHEDKA